MYIYIYIYICICILLLPCVVSQLCKAREDKLARDEFGGGEFQLEGQSWSSLYDQDDVPSTFFADLDADDESAAQVCLGVWVADTRCCYIPRTLLYA